MTPQTAPGTMREHRARYFAENGLGEAAYSARIFPVRVGPIRLPFPNPGLLPLHDLHHVLTGYGTGLVGEAEISAFELRTGCRSPIVFVLCLGSILIGLLLAPRRVARAWKRSRGAQSLYRAGIPYEELLELELTALRKRLRMPEGGLAEQGTGGCPPSTDTERRSAPT
jgi:hypothetical protein